MSIDSWASSASRSGKPSRLRKAVIPAAGLGTRFLPATKATPKEMLPKEYNDDSKLTADIKAQDNKVDYDLK